MTAAGDPPPLTGVVVVDLSRVLAGPYCTMVLADLGATVVKVERPGTGDDARHIGPFVGGVSAYFASVNRGKASVALDLADEAGIAALHEVLAGADVLVENFRPGVMDRLGLGWDALHERHPHLVVAAISGFGQTGPYADRPAYDLVVQAMSGLMSITGHADGPPTRVGTSIGDLAAALFATIGILAALRDRDRTGSGRLVDVAMLDCQVALLENALVRSQAGGPVPGPLGSRHPSIAPFAAFRAADGHLVIAAGNDRLFARLCSVLGWPALATDTRFATNAARTDHLDELTDALEAALAARPVAEWLDLLTAADVPCGPLNDLAAVLDDPHLHARNMLVPVDDPALGGLVVAGNPIKLRGVADPDRRGPVPRLPDA